ncbi:contact-dependent growth inhibition system immunity protein [Streptomyces sp. JHA26]|uniref:contact-dependent growth inhibition system immunity protein n=1 Tax=Streptomyces sp. JHA26 TaxID=1917143 RepID=UPI001180C2CA|nr:contact-dependent growth inhibition system immunity protein [Streptomyces sp. JHA26]
MLSEFVDNEKSIEDLEGDRWSDPPGESTSLVRGVHQLRKRPIKELSVEGLSRLVGQGVGLRWLLPVALDHLRDTVPKQAETGWYDDDLLTAVLLQKPSVWRDHPELARHLNETLSMLADLSPYVQRDVVAFRDALSPFQPGSGVRKLG